MTRTMIIIVSMVMMVLNTSAQRGGDRVSYREVPLSGLVAMNNSSNATTARTGRSTMTRSRRAQTQQTTARQPQNNSNAQMLADYASSSENGVVITGIVKNAYHCDIDGNIELTVQTDDIFGEKQTFYLHGYRMANLPIYSGDRVYFIAYDNGAYYYPEVRGNEIIDITAMRRYYDEYNRHHLTMTGGYMMNNPTSKWGKFFNTVNNITWTAVSLRTMWKALFGK